MARIHLLARTIYTADFFWQEINSINLSFSLSFVGRHLNPFALIKTDRSHTKLVILGEKSKVSRKLKKHTHSSVLTSFCFSEDREKKWKQTWTLKQIETQNEHQRSTKLEFELRIVYVRNCNVQPADCATGVARTSILFRAQTSMVSSSRKLLDWSTQDVALDFKY